MEEAQRKMFSNRAALPAMADVVGWLQTGPGALLRTLDLLERRELPLRVKVADSGAADGSAKGVFWALVGWLAVIVTLLVHWDIISRAPFSAPALLVFGLAGGLTAWLLTFVWKLTR